MNPPDKNTLYMQDLRTGVKSKVFEATNGWLHNYSLTPPGTAIAVQVNHERDAHLNPRLLVLPRGKRSPRLHKLMISPGVQTAGFSPIRPESATTGKFSERARGSMTSNCARLERFMTKGILWAWSPTDHNLYIWTWTFSVINQHVFRYDPSNQTPIATNLHGIFFSPTGRYYHTGFPRYNEGRVEVYDAQSNQPLLSHRPRIARVLPNARIVGWASDTDVLILEVYNQGPITPEYPQGRFDTVLYDVTNDIARIIRDDAVIGWQDGQAIVHNRGKFSKRPLALFPLLPDQTEEPSPAPTK